ncbi:MAG: hypothetical protein K2K54_06645, partial [Lachnospiraceae bacterium]|nr:hypothetical protein [Lachnospiraceae bacterium]
MSPSEFISKEPINKGWSCDKKHCAAAQNDTRSLRRIEDVLPKLSDAEAYHYGLEAGYFKDYYLQYMDGLPYKMKAPYDFGFIGKYGKVFRIFDDQDSGNICFGTQQNGQRLFVKYAGAPTKAYPGTPEDAAVRLKAAVPVYRDLKHPNLIELVEAGEMADGFGMVFRWADGDCMGRMYPAAHHKFMNLPVEERLKVFDD